MKTNIKATLLTISLVALITLLFYLCIKYETFTMIMAFILGIGVAFGLLYGIYSSIYDYLDSKKNKKKNEENMIQKSKLND